MCVRGAAKRRGGVAGTHQFTGRGTGLDAALGNREALVDDSHVDSENGLGQLDSSADRGIGLGLAH